MLQNEVLQSDWVKYPNANGKNSKFLSITPKFQKSTRELLLSIFNQKRMQSKK